MAQLVEIVEADLGRGEHQRDVLALTAAYALDPMGNGAPLPPEVLGRLIDGLKTHPTTLIFLAYLGAEAGESRPASAASPRSARGRSSTFTTWRFCRHTAAEGSGGACWKPSNERLKRSGAAR